MPTTGLQSNDNNLAGTSAVVVQTKNKTFQEIFSSYTLPYFPFFTQRKLTNHATFPT